MSRNGTSMPRDRPGKRPRSPDQGSSSKRVVRAVDHPVSNQTLADAQKQPSPLGRMESSNIRQAGPEQQRGTSTSGVRWPTTNAGESALHRTRLPSGTNGTERLIQSPSSDSRRTPRATRQTVAGPSKHWPQFRAATRTRDVEETGNSSEHPDQVSPSADKRRNEQVSRNASQRGLGPTSQDSIEVCTDTDQIETSYPVAGMERRAPPHAGNERSQAPRVHFYETPSGKPYSMYRDVKKNGELVSAQGALIPDNYLVETLEDLPEYTWICPVRDCRKVFTSLFKLGRHFANAHKTCEFNDNRDGTLSILYQHAAGTSYCIVISQDPLTSDAKPPLKPRLPDNEARAIRVRNGIWGVSQEPSLPRDPSDNPWADSGSTTSLKDAMQSSEAWQHVQMWVAGGFHDGHFNDKEERAAFIQILRMPISTLLEPRWIDCFRQKLSNRAQRRFFIVISILLRVVGVPDEYGECEACGINEAVKGCFVLPPLAGGARELQNVIGRRCSNCILFKRRCSLSHLTRESPEHLRETSTQLYQPSEDSEDSEDLDPPGLVDPSLDRAESGSSADVGEDEAPYVANDLIVAEPDLPAAESAHNGGPLPRHGSNPLPSRQEDPSGPQPGDNDILHPMPSPKTPLRLNQSPQILPSTQINPQRRESSATAIDRSISVHGPPGGISLDETYPRVIRQDSMATRSELDDMKAHLKSIASNMSSLGRRVGENIEEAEQANFVGRMLWLLSLDGEARLAFDIAADLCERGLGVTEEYIPSTHLGGANIAQSGLGAIVAELLKPSDLEREAVNIAASILRLPEDKQATAREMVRVLCSTLICMPTAPWTLESNYSGGASEDWRKRFREQTTGPNAAEGQPIFIPRIKLEDDQDIYVISFGNFRQIDVLRIRDRTWRTLTNGLNRPPQCVCRILCGRLQVRLDGKQVEMDQGEMFYIGSGINCMVRSMHMKDVLLEFDYSA